MCRIATREASRLSARARRRRHAAAVGPLRRSAWRPPARTPPCPSARAGDTPWHSGALLAQWYTRGTVGHAWHGGSRAGERPAATSCPHGPTPAGTVTIRLGAPPLPARGGEGGR